MIARVEAATQRLSQKRCSRVQAAPERDITEPNTCSCDDLMLLNGFQIANESSSPSSGCSDRRRRICCHPRRRRAAPCDSSSTIPRQAISTGTATACFCNNTKYGSIPVEGDVRGKGISFQVCKEQGPDLCLKLALNQDFDNCNVNFTSDWDYNSSYTGAWTPPSDPPSVTGNH